MSSLLEITKRSEQLLFTVKASPGASANKIRGVREGALLVAVTAAPEKGKANTAIVALLAKALGIKKSAFELLHGETSRVKVFAVEGVTSDKVRSLIP